MMADKSRDELIDLADLYMLRWGGYDHKPSSRPGEGRVMINLTRLAADGAPAQINR
jgi:hypothetical protein